MTATLKIERNWPKIIFGVCFALPSLLVFLWSIAPSFYDAVQMRQWQPVQATLTDVKLKRFTGETRTYQATAEYHYNVGEMQFEGSRVSLHSDHDNIGIYHKKMVSDLNIALDKGGSITAYYDPEHPSDSIIDRHLRWELIAFKSMLLSVFSLAGGAFIFLGWRGKATNISADVESKPWLSKPEWMHNQIYSDSKMSVYTIGLITVFWNIISGMMMLLFLENIYGEKGIWIALLIALFPAVGIYLIGLFIKTYLQWKRLGRTPLTLDPFPAAIGGQAGGEIAINTCLEKHAIYNVSLICVKKYYSGRGKDRRLRERMVWEKDGYAQLLLEGSSSALSFCFDIPDNLPESDIDEDESWHLWRVHLASSDKKLDRQFEIPVFATGETSSIKVEIPEWQQQKTNESILNEFLPIQKTSYQALINTGKEKTVIYYPMFNKPLMKLIMMIVGSIFAGVGAALWEEVSMILSIVFIMLWGLLALATFYQLLTSLTVLLDKKMLTSTHKFLGLFSRQQKAFFTDISKIESKEVMRSESAGKHTAHYQVMAILKNGKKVLLAKQVEGERAASLIMDYYCKATGATREPI